MKERENKTNHVNTLNESFLVKDLHLRHFKDRIMDSLDILHLNKLSYTLSFFTTRKCKFSVF